MNLRRFAGLMLAALMALSWIPKRAMAAELLQETGEKVVVVIDPGHGGSNLGTTANGHEEKSMTLVTALAMYDELLLYDGIEVYLTRTQDKDMTLKERAQFAESVEADFLFSIHYNASEQHDAYGAEVWVPMHAPYSTYGYQFGYEALTNFRELGLLVRGIKTRPGEKGLDYYGILRESVALEVPAVIIEHCHVDEAHDAGFCDSEEKLQLLGRRDAAAVARYFGLKSSALNVDYSDREAADTGDEAWLNALLNARTAPELCQISYVDADYEEGLLTLSVSGSDSDSGLLYYSYSIDGGETFSGRESWPGGDGLTGAYQKEFTLMLNIPPGLRPVVVVRAYNGFDIGTESNPYESPMIFPFPPEPEDSRPEQAEDPEPEAAPEKFEDLDMLIAIVMFTIAIVLSMMLALQIVEAKRRKKRRQRYLQNIEREIAMEKEAADRRRYRYSQNRESPNGRQYSRQTEDWGRSRYYQSRNEDG